MFSIVALVTLLGALLIGPTASAAEIITEDNVTVSASETYNEDVYIFSGEVQFNGTTTRDLIVGSQDLIIGDTGRINGNLNVGAQDITIRGSVDRSARVAGQTITISGTIGGDLLVAGESVTIEEGARIRGDLLVAAAEVDVAGDVDGDIRGGVGELDIANARIGGDVRVEVDDLSITGSQTTVGGSVIYESEDAANIGDDVTITGSVQRDDPDVTSFQNDFVAGGLIAGLYSLLASLIAGVVVVLLIPTTAVSIAEGVRRRPHWSLLAGIVLIIAVPILILLLMVTIIGLPIGFILLFAFLAVLYLSQVFVGLALGRLILPKSWGDAGRGYNLLAMVLGVTIIGGIRLIPVPFLSGIIAVIVALLGLGALLMRVHRAPQIGTEYPGVPQQPYASPYGGTAYR